MFKSGDKVKLRSKVTKQDLKAIALNPTTNYGTLTIIQELGFGNYSSLDYFLNSEFGALTIPAAWLEKVNEGHPHTKIFK